VPGDDMANNLFISYELNQPEKNSDRVTDAIHSLGRPMKLHRSLWYVTGNFSSEDAASKLRESMNSNDILIVIDATSNTATCYNLSEDAAAFLDKYGITTY
jgi:hypothetical protein